MALANLSRANPASPPPQLLRKAGADSRKQYEALSELVAPGIWRCWSVPWSAINRFSFDEEPASSGSAPDRNFLIALDRKQTVTADEKSEIKRFIKKNKGGRFALAIVGIAASNLSTGLQSLAAELALRVIQFRNWLDLRFFLLRLNYFCASQVFLLPDAIQAVTIGIQPLFGSSKKGPPGLLITSSFNHQRDLTLCREAARDVGRLLHAVSHLSECKIHPSLRINDVSELFTTATELVAWWFIGHGKSDKGLQDVDGQVLSSEGWLEKFLGYGKSLPLVFFSACRSADIARAFAGAGVGVAIGFDSDTLPSPCRMLAINVIQAALESRGDTNKILTAFATGCRQLQVQGLDHIKPRAYYAVN